MIKFRDGSGKLLVEYDTFISDDEIQATRELLEYENNCIVDVEILKDITQLVKGDCLVVAEYLGKQEKFKGIFNDKFKVVYFTIPSHWDIIGYLQN